MKSENLLWFWLIVMVLATAALVVTEFWRVDKGQQLLWWAVGLGWLLLVYEFIRQREREKEEEKEWERKESEMYARQEELEKQKKEMEDKQRKYEERLRKRSRRAKDND